MLTFLSAAVPFHRENQQNSEDSNLRPDKDGFNRVESRCIFIWSRYDVVVWSWFTVIVWSWYDVVVWSWYDIVVWSWFNVIVWSCYDAIVWSYWVRISNGNREFRLSRLGYGYDGARRISEC